MTAAVWLTAFAIGAVTENPEGRADPGSGRLFEDFRPGEVIYHPFGKTVTEADNQTFTLMTQNVARIHLDKHFAARTEFGRPLHGSAVVHWFAWEANRFSDADVM